MQHAVVRKWADPRPARMAHLRSALRSNLDIPLVLPLAHEPDDFDVLGALEVP